MSANVGNPRALRIGYTKPSASGCAMAATGTNLGANWEITVDGKPRSYRDDLRVAAEATNYLKIKNPKSEVCVRDLRTNAVTVAQWTAPADISQQAKDGRSDRSAGRTRLSWRFALSNFHVRVG